MATGKVNIGDYAYGYDKPHTFKCTCSEAKNGGCKGRVIIQDKTVTIRDLAWPESETVPATQVADATPDGWVMVAGNSILMARNVVRHFNYCLHEAIRRIENES
jgi:hypothetical protein